MMASQPASAADAAQSAIDPRTANAAGMSALGLNDFAAAARHFAQAVEADPAAPELWRNLALAHRELGDDQAEAAALDGAIAADARDFMAWLRKAQLHQRRGETRDALIAWSGVLQLSAALDPVPPALALTLDQARGWCAAQQQALAASVDRAIGPAVAAMTPGEHRRIRGFVDHALKARQVYRNECAGLYYPFLPADEFFDDAHFPWFAGLAAAAPAIRREFEALIADGTDALRPYVQLPGGTPDSKWTGLDGTLDWGAAFLWEYGAPNWPLLDRCPAAAAALARVPTAPIAGRSPNVFFSVLRPRTRIPAHTGVTNSRAIIHLPLIVPENCGFRVGGETRRWVEGQPFAFDDTIEHEAWNDSDQLRAVLIFDVWNPHLSAAETAAIAHYYAAVDAAATAKRAS